MRQSLQSIHSFVIILPLKCGARVAGNGNVSVSCSSTCFCCCCCCYCWCCCCCSWVSNVKAIGKRSKHSEGWAGIQLASIYWREIKASTKLTRNVSGSRDPCRVDTNVSCCPLPPFLLCMYLMPHANYSSQLSLVLLARQWAWLLFYLLSLGTRTRTHTNKYTHTHRHSKVA